MISLLLQRHQHSQSISALKMTRCATTSDAQSSSQKFSNCHHQFLLYIVSTTPFALAHFSCRFIYLFKWRHPDAEDLAMMANHIEPL